MVIIKDKILNLKEFFVPNGKKIILTVTLTILTYIHLFTSIIVEAPAVYKQPVFLKIFGFPLFSCFLFEQLPLTQFLCLFLSPIIIWYILVCIVFFIYNKFRKKPNNF